MKLRSGFVSNSSTSSYVLVYSPISVTELGSLLHTLRKEGASWNADDDVYYMAPSDEGPEIALMPREMAMEYLAHPECYPDVEIIRVHYFGDNEATLSVDTLKTWLEAASKSRLILAGGECTQNVATTAKSFREYHFQDAHTV